MKKIAAIFSIGMLLYTKLVSQEIPPAPADKAVVYFVRTSGLGFAINFSYLDSATLIAKANGTNYVRYECNPGNHIFWARTENRDYVEAELEPGKIYFLEAVPTMGAIRAAVQLRPVDPSNADVMKRIFKLMNKKKAETPSPEELKKESEEMQEVITRGLEKYKEEKEKGKKPDRLEKHMYYTPKS
jgi:hypothetical protein